MKKRIVTLTASFERTGPDGVRQKVTWTLTATSDTPRDNEDKAVTIDRQKGGRHG